MFSAGFPAPQEKFVGREDYVARFKSRLEHFRFFLYEGIAGVGKTSLMLRLVREASAANLQGSIYLDVQPGEAIASVLGRLECRLLGTGRINLDQQGDPYVRLVDLLHSRRLVLILDSLQHLRKDDLLTLVRVLYRAKLSDFRVLGAIRGDPALSAIDRGQLHLERLGALTPANAVELGKRYGLSTEALAIVESDAQRGGALAHPLTARYVMGLCGSQLPPKEFLDTQSARSVHAFKACRPYWDAQLTPEERRLLGRLARIGTPVARAVAEAALGAALPSLAERGLLEVIDDEVGLHPLAVQVFAPGEPMVGQAAQRVAASLAQRAREHGLPLAAIRGAEVLAHAGFIEQAVEALSQSGDWVKDPGFLEAYRKALATVPAEGAMASRLKFLASQARMHQGNPMVVLGEMTQLTQDADRWTRTRALVALAYTHSQLNAPAKVIAAYEALKQTEPDADSLLTTGMLAAEAMMRLEQWPAAERLVENLLQQQVNQSKSNHEAHLHWLLGRIDASTGRLAEAVTQVRRAAACFAAGGDQYHTAVAHGFVGDLYREAGDFAQAKAAYSDFLQCAIQWGDRSLIHLAELADAWVSLDMGDVAHAAKKVAEVTKEVSVAPSGRLRRYLAAAQALLEAGRGHHEKAASLLTRVVEAWDAAGQRSMAGSLYAQLVRSLIACDKLEEAHQMVQRALQGLQPETAGPRIASLLRESALIHLRRGEPERAMVELGEARTLFAKGGNRREEALTLHRIAHAALDEGNIEFATQKAAEALDLATKIKHPRARALAFELLSRIALLNGDADATLNHARDAQQSLRRLGDELGVLHVTETLLRGYLFAGDLAAALRLGPKLRDLAARLEVPEVRTRAVAFTGITLLRKERLDVAQRCFRELPSKEVSPWTASLMNRFGEALALAQNNQPEALRRRGQWLRALRRMAPGRRVIAIAGLQQLALAPQDRCELRQPSGRSLLGTEELGLLQPRDFQLFVDVLYRRIYHEGEVVRLTSALQTKLLMRLVLASPAPVPTALVLSTLQPSPGKKKEQKLRDAHKALQLALKEFRHLSIELLPQGLRLVPPQHFAFLLPVWLTHPVTDSQKHILKLLRKLGSAPIQTILDQCNLSRAAARKDMGQLTKTRLVQAVREGRGQVYRLM